AALLVALAVPACSASPTDAPPDGGGASAGLPEDIRSSGRLAIGSELTTPPLTYRGEDGKTILGLNHDLAQALGERLGVEVVFEQYAFAGLIPAVQSGKADMAMDIINDTAERQRVVDFVDYLENGTTMLLRKGNPDGIRVLADLCGRSAALVRGSVQIPLVQEQSDRCVAEGRPPVELMQFAAPPEARLQVQHGRVSAFFGNTPVMIYLAENAEGGTVFEAATSEQYLPQPVGMIFAKGDTQLRDAVLAALQQLFDDGTYAALLEKYHLTDLALEKPTVNGASR
ncbi:MAG: ABC transporter substrate-binding protein, partial [Pseudonocardia sp.]